MDRAPNTKILLCLTQDKRDRFERVLAGHEVAYADNVKSAMDQLEASAFGLVLVGVHFDDSQMFTLLGDIRGHARYRKVPILCVLGQRGSVLARIAVEGLEHAVRAMTANGFVDLDNYPDDETGNARLRRIVDYLILLDGELHQGLPE